jgi:hypothetical protein
MPQLCNQDSGQESGLHHPVTRDSTLRSQPTGLTLAGTEAHHQRGNAFLVEAAGRPAWPTLAADPSHGTERGRLDQSDGAKLAANRSSLI